MKLSSIISLILVTFVAFSCSPSSSKGGSKKKDPSAPKVKLVNHKSNQEVDVTIGGKPFTSYSYSDSLMKEILYPIYTAGGHFLTRGWPIKPRPGEHTDHPHHKGMWLNYSNVNGYDFWNNSYAIPPKERKVHYGRIEHSKITNISSGKGKGSLVTHERWISPFGNQLLSEKTVYHFIAKTTEKGPIRIIDRITTLTADSTVTFNDDKDGFFAIRYNKHLKLPVKHKKTFKDAMGNVTTVTPTSKGITGDYLSSEGITGYDVWGTRAKWVDLYGNIEGEKVSLVICDHPKNFDYPTYWHARGYGLFAANPFGAHDFTDGKLTINYTLPKGQSITFRYQVIISSGFHLTNDEINGYAHDFDRKYW